MDLRKDNRDDCLGNAFYLLNLQHSLLVTWSCGRKTCADQYCIDCDFVFLKQYSSDDYYPTLDQWGDTPKHIWEGFHKDLLIWCEIRMSLVTRHAQIYSTSKSFAHGLKKERYILSCHTACKDDFVHKSQYRWGSSVFSSSISVGLGVYT